MIFVMILAGISGCAVPGQEFSEDKTGEASWKMTENPADDHDAMFRLFTVKAVTGLRLMAMFIFLISRCTQVHYLRFSGFRCH